LKECPSYEQEFAREKEGEAETDSPEVPVGDTLKARRETSKSKEGGGHGTLLEKRHPIGRGDPQAYG